MPYSNSCCYGTPISARSQTDFLPTNTRMGKPLTGAVSQDDAASQVQTVIPHTSAAEAPTRWRLWEKTIE